MKITTVKYEKTFNLGNYESEKIGAEAAIAETDNAAMCLEELKAFVNSKPTKAVSVQEEVKQEPKEEVKPELKKAEKKAEPKKEEVKAEVKEVKAKPATKKKEKITPYNRDTDSHKAKLAAYLDASHQGWRTNVTKAKEASMKLNGIPFLNEEGTIIDSFKEAFSKELA